ncbi:hypothetical protein MLD38_006526 [Melastoma candidum]|uniref:Uncharacterized protein n=1 Tax=Melastoma candidum TaxID=119954 RepID=A0ACB9RMV9_9MYRT|nr:hypothetical protein MLD38_006526 [Melastoma candidum]
MRSGDTLLSCRLYLCSCIQYQDFKLAKRSELVALFPPSRFSHFYPHATRFVIPPVDEKNVTMTFYLFHRNSDEWPIPHG